MKLIQCSCRSWLNGFRRQESGHAFIESLIFMTIFMVLVMVIVSLCGGPIVGGLAVWFGLVDHPLTFQQSFAFTFCAIYSLIATYVLGHLFIEWPASVLDLNMRGYGYRLQFDSNWKVLGYNHFSRLQIQVRQGFRVFAVIASLLIGYWLATGLTFGRLTPQGVMVLGSMAALAPVAWLFAFTGMVCPPLRRFMTTRPVFVPAAAE